MTKNWRAIPSLDGRYEASSNGGVRNAKTLHVLVCPVGSRGYRLFTPKRDGKQRNVLVHSVVCECFLGPRPTGMVINHIDGNRLNNAHENLEYCTPQQNEDHAVRLGLKVSGDKHHMRIRPELVKRGAKNGNAKLSEFRVLLAREMHKSGATCEFLGKLMGVSDVCVGNVVNGRTWISVTQ